MCMKKYDYIIVGSGLFAGTFAYLARQKGKRCLVLEKRNEIGGNLYCEDREGIHVHKYGAHIFHTSNRAVWDFVNSLVELIAIRILQWQIIMERCIICLLI